MQQSRMGNRGDARWEQGWKKFGWRAKEKFEGELKTLNPGCLGKM